MATQSDMLRFVAGQAISIGPRQVWNPSTGNKLSLSTYSGIFTCKDYAGGNTVFQISTGASTAAGRLKFSVAASGQYWLYLLPAATSVYGGVHCVWDLRISAAGRGGPLVLQRGSLHLEDKL